MDAAKNLGKTLPEAPSASSVIKQHHFFREYRCLLFLAAKEHAIYKPVASTITYFQEVFRDN